MNTRGNVLFLILIAVALFAALSYAVTQSSSGGGNNISKEKAELHADRILQFTSSVKFAVERMQLIKGVEDHEIDIRTQLRPLVNGSLSTQENLACTNSKCQIYHPDGGGVDYMSFEDAAQIDPLPSGWQATWAVPGHHDLYAANVHGIGSDLPDILLRIVALKTDVCKALNRKLGLPETITIDWSGESIVYFWGNTTVSALTSTNQLELGDDAGEEAVDGQMAFCFTNADNGEFWRVLKAR